MTVLSFAEMLELSKSESLDSKGFKLEYADRIFRIFQQLEHSAEIHKTGIGLACCKKMSVINS